MNKRITIIALTFLALVVVFLVLHTFGNSSVAARPVRLVVTGPSGQHFSGSYVADGVTNSLDAIAPATITLQAVDVNYEFKREGGNGEFRVALYIGDLCRTTATSDKKTGVRGQLRYAATHESYWAAGF
jgi:hypothetical protein